jgi:hypothetical protein
MRWADVHARLMERSRDLQALTPSQFGAAAAIVRALESGVQYLNLWGAAGVGKTFLVRQLVQQHQGLYLSSPDQPFVESPAGKWLCVDNMRATRSEARSIYSKLLWQGATAVLVVTQSSVPDSLFPVELQLTAQDWNTVRSTLVILFRNANKLSNLDANALSLWPLVCACTHADMTINQG